MALAYPVARASHVCLPSTSARSYRSTLVYTPAPRRSDRVCFPLRRKHATSWTVASGESEQTAMTVDEAYKLLGVRDGASFDEILSAKNRKVSAEADDEQKVQIDVAYDMLLMHSMKKRLSGELEVSRSVRFADVAPKRKAGVQQTGAQAVLGKLPGALKLKKSADSALATQTAVFAALAVWSVFQGLSEPPGVAVNDVPGLQLSVGVCAAVYFLRDSKKLSFPRAGGLTAAGLVAGALIGGLLQSWLRVDIVPIGAFNSPGIFVSEFTLIGMWAACAFLS